MNQVRQPVRPALRRSSVVGLLGAELNQRGQQLPPVLDVGTTVAGVVQLLLFFKLAFMIREILGDHLKAVLSELSGHPSEYVVDLSWILTLLLSIWYLQFKINECATFSEEWTAMSETPAAGSEPSSGNIAPLSSEGS